MFVRAKSYRLFRRIDTRADITGKSRREREMPLAFLNGPGDSETIGAAKRHCNQERKRRMISFQVFAGLTGYHSEPEYLKS